MTRAAAKTTPNPIDTFCPVVRPSKPCPGEVEVWLALVVEEGAEVAPEDEEGEEEEEEDEVEEEEDWEEEVVVEEEPPVEVEESVELDT